MSFLEFLAAAVLAVYAMVGGAFLNASITAPQNAAKVLVAGWQTIFEFLINGVLILLICVVLWFLLDTTEPFHHNPFIWVGAGHLALGAIFYWCRVIVAILIDGGDHQEGQ